MSIKEYIRPGQLIAVDCIIFGYEKSELKILLFKRIIEPEKGHWSLLGGWVNTDEMVESAAARVLEQITGLTNIFLEQVHVFSEPKRDRGGRVISIAFYALINIAEHDSELVRSHKAEWWPLNNIPKLIFDHQEMVDKALAKLRLSSSYELQGKHLLPELFTITQLRNLYDAIYGRNFDPGNFRRKIFKLKVLEKQKIKDNSASKKGAYFYKFIHDKTQGTGERIVNYKVSDIN